VVKRTPVLKNKEKKKEKSWQGHKNFSELRKKAKDLYMKSGGVLNNTSLATKLGIDRGTVAGWKSKFEWDKEIELAKEELQQQTGEMVAKRFVDELQKFFERDLSHLKLLDNAIGTRFFKRDNSGRIIFQDDGEGKQKPVIDRDLDLGTLTKIAELMERKMRMVNMLMGKTADGDEPLPRDEFGRVSVAHSHRVDSVPGVSGTDPKTVLLAARTLLAYNMSEASKVECEVVDAEVVEKS
jgi:hypothetical protein